jgi:hypothetical protein
LSLADDESCGIDADAETESVALRCGGGLGHDIDN